MTEPRTGLALHGIEHSFDGNRVLDCVDLTVARGEIVCLLGASGSGKTTLLRIVAGLESLQGGAIELDGRVFAEPGNEPLPEQRNFGLVFQDHVLFPHLTVGENVAFGLADRGQSEREGIVAARLLGVGLDGFADRYPHTLSGGQQQRVALARALAPEPDVMLLDEPFASVDTTLRRRLREDARRALKASSSPTIVVTHDAEEAFELADRIAVMDEGRIVQEGAPESLWLAPANRFVAELLGEAEAIAGRVSGRTVETAFGAFDLDGRDAVDGACDVVTRPSHVHVVPEDGGCVVADIRFLGDRYLIIVQSGDESLRSVVADKPPLEPGQAVRIDFDPSGVLLYNR